MGYPNNNCGECIAWLAMETNKDKELLIKKCCTKCDLFNSQTFVKHIPSGCCYPLEEDGKTVIICGANLTPKIDGEIFWEYVDTYTHKEVKPSNQFRENVR